MTVRARVDLVYLQVRYRAGDLIAIKAEHFDPATMERVE